MAVSPIHDYFIHQHQLKPISEFVPQKNEGGIYEVLRVVNGVPLFFEEHLERLHVSAQLSGIKVEYVSDRIKELLNNLISANKVETGNILISVKENFKAFFITHVYPGDELYQSGVECGILHAERVKPNAKVFQTNVRLMADELMKTNNLYEVMLVDHLGRITEGSRSNLFFIKDEKIITPPGNEVLLGITRTKAIEVGIDLGFKVAEEDVYLKDLNENESAFITGTSPKILPVKRIGHIEFNPQNKILQHLISGYNQLIEAYVVKNKS